MNLQEFLRKAREKEANKIKVAQIEIKDFGKVEFSRPTDKDISSYFDDMTRAGDANFEENNIKGMEFEKITDAAKKLVYNCCPVLQAKETREEFKNREPYDIPLEIFGSLETIEIASKILSTFKIVEEQKKDEKALKNSLEIAGNTEGSTGSPTISKEGTN